MPKSPRSYWIGGNILSLLEYNKPSHEITLDEFIAYINLPENRDKRFELIENQIYLMSSPSSLHARILTYISGEIFIYLRGRQCELFNALDIHLPSTKGKTNVFCPDLFINCNPDRIKKNFCLGAPEFIIEVASPSTDFRDYGVKRWLYMAYGVKEYWIIDPIVEKVTVYSAIADSTGDIIEKHYSFERPVNVNLFEGLVLDVSQLKNFL